MSSLRSCSRNASAHRTLQPSQGGGGTFRLCPDLTPVPAIDDVIDRSRISHSEFAHGSDPHENWQSFQYCLLTPSLLLLLLVQTPHCPNKLLVHSISSWFIATMTSLADVLERIANPVPGINSHHRLPWVTPLPSNGTILPAPIGEKLSYFTTPPS
jgi:hypothetical protein